MAHYHLSVANVGTVSSKDLLKALAKIDSPEARKIENGLNGIVAFGIAYTNQDFDLMSAARHLISSNGITLKE